MATVQVTVFRAVRKEEFPNGTIIGDKPADGVLHPSFVKTLITGGKRKGQWRDPDVQTFTSGDVLYAQTGAAPRCSTRRMFSVTRSGTLSKSRQEPRFRIRSRSRGRTGTLCTKPIIIRLNAKPRPCASIR